MGESKSERGRMKRRVAIGATMAALVVALALACAAAGEGAGLWGLRGAALPGDGSETSAAVGDGGGEGGQGAWGADDGSHADSRASDAAGAAEGFEDAGSGVGGNPLVYTEDTEREQIVHVGDAVAVRFKEPGYRIRWVYSDAGKVYYKEFAEVWPSSEGNSHRIEVKLNKDGSVAEETTYSWDSDAQRWLDGDDWREKIVFRKSGAERERKEFSSLNRGEYSNGGDDGWISSPCFEDSIGMPVGVPSYLNGTYFRWDRCKLETDSNGRLVRRVSENQGGETWSYDYVYDAEGRLTQVWKAGDGGRDLAEERTYNRDGLLERIDLHGMQNDLAPNYVTFAYDEQGRIAVQGIGVDVSGEGADAAARPLAVGSG